MRDLLELKNISAVLGRPPVRSGRLASDLFQTAFAAGGTFEWDPGVRLVYNQRFSRSRSGQGHSYSVPLIPDIALSIPDGPNAGLHLFDAKFRVQALADVGLAADGWGAGGGWGDSGGAWGGGGGGWWQEDGGRECGELRVTLGRMLGGRAEM